MAESSEEDGKNEGPLNVSPNDYKAFVGGLDYRTTEEGMKLYFSQFGPVLDASIKQDKFTGQSRSFGFVSFNSDAALRRACDPEVRHSIDGKEVEVKVAFSRGSDAEASSSVAKESERRTPESLASQFQDPELKIFVGGLLPETKEDDLESYFSKYGDVRSVVIKYDAATQRSRGFAFVTFNTLEAVEKASQQTMQIVLGKKVEIKRYKKSGGDEAESNEEEKDEQESPPKRVKFADRKMSDIYRAFFEAQGRMRHQMRPPPLSFPRGPPPPRGPPTQRRGPPPPPGRYAPPY